MDGHAQVYNNNGLPLGAAIAIPIGVILVVACLLLAAKAQRARTERSAPTYTPRYFQGFMVIPGKT